MYQQRELIRIIRIVALYHEIVLETLKWALHSFGDGIQTQNCYIYNIHEVMSRGQKYLPYIYLFP